MDSHSRFGPDTAQSILAMTGVLMSLGWTMSICREFPSIPSGSAGSLQYPLGIVAYSVDYGPSAEK